VKLSFEKLNAGAEFVLTCVSVVAIPVAGYWAYHNFTVEDTHAVNPNIAVSAEVLPYDADKSLLVVHVKPRNPGKVPIKLKEGDIDVLVETIPPGLCKGHVDDELGVRMFSDGADIIGSGDSYTMEPGVEYDEVQLFVVPKGQTYLVNAAMFGFTEDPAADVNDSAVVKVDLTDNKKSHPEVARHCN
jgi:hypothetical protein